MNSKLATKIQLLSLLSALVFAFAANAAPSKTAEKNAEKAEAAKLSYSVKMNLSVNGKKIADTSIVVAAGETGSVTNETENGETLFMDVTAKEVKSKADQPTVELEFLVGKVAANGERIIISSPSIVALENEEAEVRSVDENQSISVSVTAARTKL